MSLKNQVRLISGDFRRQILKFPNIQDLRPTPERVRETVFNWLGQFFHDKNLVCLDLFAGSGAMGIEAYSRGAKQVILIEKFKKIQQAVKENLIRIKMIPNQENNDRKIEILCQDAFDYLKSTTLQFDVIFIDPPYRNREYLIELLPVVISKLKANGKIYLESDQKFELSDDLKEFLEIYRQDKAGMVNYYLFNKL